MPQSKEVAARERTLAMELNRYSVPFQELMRNLGGDIQFSLVIFGHNYFIIWVLNRLIVYLIILNLMGKLRL